jgi:YhcH/YjgK/YiaL family protein
MALFGSFATIRAQAPQTPGFRAAFAYIEDLLRPDAPARLRLAGITAGDSRKIPLEGGAFAIEQVYETKARPDGFFESHRKYIDVQVIVEGDEVMEVIDASRISVREAYAPDRDLITYQDAPDASRLRVTAGQAAIFYPVDVHMPSLRVGAGPELVRKTVVKVPVDA